MPVNNSLRNYTDQVREEAVGLSKASEVVVEQEANCIIEGYFYPSRPSLFRGIEPFSCVSNCFRELTELFRQKTRRINDFDMGMWLLSETFHGRGVLYNIST